MLFRSGSRIGRCGWITSFLWRTWFWNQLFSFEGLMSKNFRVHPSFWGTVFFFPVIIGFYHRCLRILSVDQQKVGCFLGEMCIRDSSKTAPPFSPRCCKDPVHRCRLNSVSYTHLDVYKRQALSRTADTKTERISVQ